jgi:predicted phosphoribosyltransferase
MVPRAVALALIPREIKELARLARYRMSQCWNELTDKNKVAVLFPRGYNTGTTNTAAIEQRVYNAFTSVTSTAVINNPPIRPAYSLTITR